MRIHALILALLLTACFDYAEQVKVEPSGAGRISVRYSYPEWLAADNPELLSDGGLRAVYGAEGRQIGYEGNVAAVDKTFDEFLRRRFTVRQGGLYRYEVRIAFPATYAAQVSASIERYAKAAPFMNVTQLNNMRANALRSLGPRFKVELPGKVLSTNGAVNESRVEWKVPLQTVLAKPEIVLFAEGRLGLRDRVSRAFSRWFAPPFDRR